MKIVFFDGYCNLCNGLIEWLVRADKKGVLKIASLQGETAKASLPSDKRSDHTDVNTVIYLRNGIQYECSTAVLMAVTDLGGVWKLAKVFFIVPRALRDFIYSGVAKSRYRIFGKREVCRLPTPDERGRFLA